MIKIIFKENEVELLRNTSLNHPHQQVRLKALVLLLKSQHIPHHKIAATMGICENTLRTYCKAFSQGGMETVAKLNFRKPESKLVPFEEQVKAYLRQSPPASIKQACAEIEKLTGIKLKPTQMRKYLKSLGANFRKVCTIPAKANIVEQKNFLECELNPRLEEAKKGKRTVYFVDAAHFVLGAFLGFLWSLTRVFVKTPSGRQRFNVLGALNAITKELTMVTNTTYITSTQVCELMKIIAQNHSTQTSQNPVTIVLDNAKYQRCKVVIDEAERLKIELLFLPTYSPNLNLIERIWKFAKKHCLNARYYPTFKPFKNAINNFLATMHSTHEEELKALLTLNFQTFTEEQLNNAI